MLSGQLPRSAGADAPRGAGAVSTALKVGAVLLASGAMVCLGFAVAGMVTGHQSPRAGYLLRVGALACFGAAVVLNVIAH